MYDESFYDWKIIPRFYMKNEFDNNCRLYFNLDYKLKTNFYCLYPTISLGIPTFIWTIFYGIIFFSKITFTLWWNYVMRMANLKIDLSLKWSTVWISTLFAIVTINQCYTKSMKNIFRDNINYHCSLRLEDHHILQISYLRC